MGGLSVIGKFNLWVLGGLVLILGSAVFFGVRELAQAWSSFEPVVVGTDFDLNQLAEARRGELLFFLGGLPLVSFGMVGRPLRTISTRFRTLADQGTLDPAASDLRTRAGDVAEALTSVSRSLGNNLPRFKTL
ncbi:MAG TPA: hypothetical protein VMB23_09340 [Spirochaetia bacterium]|nr:hypothetical protein [Spirochaetia bacterium]